jgi:transcriptional regulator with XRE-family HTH domain
MNDRKSSKMNTKSNKSLGEIIRQQRVTIPLTLQELSAQSGVSPSHLGRMERGERFPSASILRKIAKPLGFDEGELFVLANYLPPQPSGTQENTPRYVGLGLDPNVARLLGQESVEVQRAVIGLLAILKNLARSTRE